MNLKIISRNWLRSGIFAGVFTALLAPSCHAQQFQVDFSRFAGTPLIKTKFGVYQTPLVQLPRLLDSVSLLKEIKVQDLRYEMGWGKPESLAASQIGGTAAEPTLDFLTVDALAKWLRDADIRPLWAMGYCPDPLKTRTEWASWKDMPRDLKAWHEINRQYAAHLKTINGVGGSSYEIWNEPDMPEPNGKMFFSGGAQEYRALYGAGRKGIGQGDPDASVGGPAAAYDLSYLTPLLSEPLDFASIHGYDNFASQIGGMRASLSPRPDVPIFLTEYASFTNLPPDGPQSRTEGAMRFFQDAKALLDLTDVTRVYWAQWLDAGDAPGMGLVTHDGHRKAIFNAFKIYGAMPVDRNAVTAKNATGLGVLASSDAHKASVVLWNQSQSQRSITIDLNRLPFGSGSLHLYRIDKNHSSYVDNPASENLQPLQNLVFRNRKSLVWKGDVPACGVIYLEVVDGHDTSPPKARNNNWGHLVHCYRWFPQRKSLAYADFDARSATARIGLGESDIDLSQIGCVIDDPAPKLRLQVKKSGSLPQLDHESLFGLHLDFQSQNGTYNRSVLIHGGLYDASRTSALPWGKRGAIPDQVVFEKRLNNGRPFELNIARLAPKDWNGRRVVLTFQIQNTGRGSWAKFVLSASPKMTG